VLDLGNGGRPNPMKFGKDIGHDELLPKHTLIDFVNGCLKFPVGAPIRGPKSPENASLSESQLSGRINITKDPPPAQISNRVACFY